MSKGKTAVITTVVIIAALAVVLFGLATQTNLLLFGDYYVKIDNAQLSQNDAEGGVIHLESSEPYVYELDAINEAGDTAKIEFGVSRELRQDAYLKLELQPIRGVVTWSEVSADELPPKAAKALG